ncbi:DUF5999 family protein [Streptomyces sp. NPDC048290]|uniref:DUF5999 family protein n=1 Tax=Streptomyces sp. NPDC048290 TaxID=3155811 RepID=UPI00342835B4
MCAHQPSCTAPTTAQTPTAHLVSAHPEQGWSLLCDGTLVFDDSGELRPDGRIVAPHRTALAA